MSRAICILPGSRVACQEVPEVGVRMHILMTLESCKGPQPYRRTWELLRLSRAATRRNLMARSCLCLHVFESDK